MLRQDDLRRAVDHVVNVENRHNIAEPVRRDLMERLMYVLARFQKERNFGWRMKEE